MFGLFDAECLKQQDSVCEIWSKTGVSYTEENYMSLLVLVFMGIVDKKYDKYKYASILKASSELMHHVHCDAATLSWNDHTIYWTCFMLVVRLLIRVCVCVCIWLRSK